MILHLCLQAGVNPELVAALDRLMTLLCVNDVHQVW